MEERQETPEARRAAQEEFLPGAVAPGGWSRREFLGALGAGTALLASGCDWKDRSSVVPYTRRPPEVVPGVANHYATTYPEGQRSYAVLVKTREGRPIHVTGNDEHPGLRGKTSPRAVAAVAGLYDPDRLRAPRVNGRASSWADARSSLVAAVAACRRGGRRILLVTGAVTSPTRLRLLADLKAALPDLDHVTWEPAAARGAREGALAAFGLPVATRLRLEQAEVILSLGSDFLNGEDPEAARGFAVHRRPRNTKEPMNRLWALEGPMTLTGANADHRHPVRPSHLAALAFALAGELHRRHGLPLPPGTDLPPIQIPAGDLPPGVWHQLVDDLARAGRKAVVACGDWLPPEAHVATHLLNAMLRSGARDLRPGRALDDLDPAVRAMAAGTYGAALLWQVNPVYAYPRPDDWRNAFLQVPTRVWLGLAEDETTPYCHLVLPEHHWLEAWGDHADGGLLTLQQPTVGPLYDTRQGEDILLALLDGLGAPAAPDYHSYLRERWRAEVQPPGSVASFDRFFQAALHDGVAQGRLQVPPAPPFLGASVAPAALRAAQAVARDAFELVLRPGTQVHDGRHANNAWLQELPDPVTKATWGNPLTVSVADAGALGLRDGDLATVDVAGRWTTFPVLVQPGQAQGVLATALGYGRTAGSVARGVGFNAYPLLDPLAPAPNLRLGVGLAKALGRLELPVTQNHHRMDGRDLVRSHTLAEFAKLTRQEPDLATLYPDQAWPEHKWGMAIDLSTCTGCSACVVACQSENNIPSVGPRQVLRGREMHWLRIDRYYEGDEHRPRVVHQPMLCQHCDAAPCENVCPVNATNHSPDGLNQMVYNRCVGTRYCANNCPYKVRRFNFLEYQAGKAEPERLAFNPEVTVRPRGVMEKCTFCVQRIQDGRMRARTEHRPLRDGDITPACAAACPTEAIVFGDLKDPGSRVARLAKATRGYQVLEELGARPAITYLADLRNPAGGGP